MTSNKTGQKIAQTASRKRWLNFIYFVDAKETKSFKVRLDIARMIGVAVILGFIWFIASFFVIGNLLSRRNLDEIKIKSLLATVFDYQTRHDSVYEAAYEDKTADPEKDSQLPSSDDETDTLRVTDPSNLAKVEMATAETKETAPNEVALASKDSLNETLTPVSIENALVQIKGTSLEVSFNLKNNLKNKASQGYFWGIATIASSGGEKKTLLSPEKVILSTEGKPTRLNQGYGYRISFFTSKDVSFAIPSEGSYRVLSLEIGASSEGKVYRFIYTAQPEDDFSTPQKPSFVLVP